MKHIVRFGFIAFFGAALLASCTAQVDMSEDPEQEQVGMDMSVDPEQEQVGEAVDALSFCQCTTYVYNRFALSNPAYPNATDWGNYLTGMGYVKYTTPQAGDIIVMKAGHTGADATAGHIGVVTSFTTSTIGVRGANQGGSASEYNCNNVNTINFTRQSAYESYYRKGTGSSWNCANSAYNGVQYWTCSGGTLYKCVNGVPTTQTCSSGCTSNPVGTNDTCNTSISWNCANSAYNGAQYWTCSGGNLYKCVSGVPQKTTCANGCNVNAVGTNDTCK